MSAPAQLIDLVERFHDNLDSYKRDEYKEAHVREEFINPMMELLGWDMTNRRGWAEAYKEVVHEDSLQIEGVPKSPDYAFRIGGTKKFYLEAKKPRINVRDDIEPSYQLRRYAWTAKLPLSILTDFEEWAVYDCRIKPEKTDKASKARVKYLKYTEYPEKWDEIAGVFSREAILRGAFDRYADETKSKRGTAEVDDAFLKEIEGWREVLAQEIARRNKELSQREVNFAVQRTIDRIVFLRICEARGVEPYQQLAAATKGKGVYARLCDLFRHADQKYNSGLFHFSEEKGRPDSPDLLTLHLSLDDKPLRDIVQNLYFPHSPYEFSVLPADILGHVYERFLGKVIVLDSRHRATVEDKPEVRKAGGVFYTPTYIVEYIVQQTVGHFVKGKTAKQVEALRVLDPACGSGSFLLGAYQYLLDWYRNWYVENGGEKWAKGRNPKLYQNTKGEWRLTTSERKRILLNNIYGVDIDISAVEVTKLSLLLKVLEGETEQTLSAQLKLFAERALPTLDENIKSGNSLIGPDFYDSEQLGLLDEETRYRVNAFSWETEFREIMRSGGFDAVIGNPPYVLLQDAFRDDAQLGYFRDRYSVASFKLDLYHLFIERGVRITKPGGRCSMITPANFLTNNYLGSLRRFLLQETSIDHIVVIEKGVFKSVSVDSAIFVAERGGSETGTVSVRTAVPDRNTLQFRSEVAVSIERTLLDKHVLFTGSGNSDLTAIWDRVYARSVKLDSIAFVNFGKQLRDRKKHPTDVIEVAGVDEIEGAYRACYNGRDIARYQLTWGHLACLDDPVARSGGCWDSDRHDTTGKLLTRQIGRHPEFALDTAGYQCLNTIFMINFRSEAKVDPRFVLGLLNSRLTRAIWLDRFYDKRRTFPKIKGTYLKELPVYALDRSESADIARHDRMVSLVVRMLALHEQYASAKIGHDKTLIGRQIEATDRQIDRLVYELYALTEQEIKLIEKA